MRAIGYCRMSEASDNVKVQEHDIRELAEERGYDLSLFADNGTSAWRSSKPRRGYLAMVAAVQHGADALLVYNVDRLSRWARPFMELVDTLTERRILVIQTDGTEIRSWTGDGRKQLQEMAIAAEHQSTRASERLQRAHRRIAAEGWLAAGGKRSFGYQRIRVQAGDRTRASLEIVPEEAEIIRELAARALKRESIIGLTRWLNDSGIPAVSGGRWRRAVVKTLLRSARISGQREHKLVLSHANWEPIIDPMDTLRLRAILNAHREPTRRRSLLGGILRCGKCGAVMGSYLNHSYRTYICRRDEGGCGGVVVSASFAEEKVVTALLERRGSLAIEPAGAASEAADALVADITAARQSLAELGALTAAGKLSPLALSMAVGPLEERIAAAERSLGELPADEAPLISEWPNLTLEERRYLIRALVATAVVMPVGKAKVGRADRVKLTFSTRLPIA